MRICAVIFDYGMVLSGPPHPDIKTELIRRTGMEPACLEDLYWKHRLDYDRGDLNGLTYWQLVLDQGGVASTPELVHELAELDARMWTGSNPPLVAWHAQLRAAGLKTALLSNLGDVVTASVLQNLPWMQNFDVQVFSHQLHIVKPDPAIYRHTLEALGSEAQETIFVDDVTSNVEAARAVGLIGIQYTNVQQLNLALSSLELGSALPLPNPHEA